MGENLNELKMLCPFCNTILPAKITNEIYEGGGCDTCGPDYGATLEVRCSNTDCKKVVYKKEY